MIYRIRSFLLGLGIVVLIAVSSPAQPKFTAALNSAQLHQPTNSPGRAVCHVTFTNNVVTQLTCEYSGLTGNLYSAVIFGGGTCGSLVQGGTSGSFSLPCNPPYGPPPPTLTSLLQKKAYVVFFTNPPFVPEIQGQLKIVTLDNDVNGEGRAEISIFRPSESAAWAYCGLKNGPIWTSLNWDPNYEKPFLADFDGDGIADWSFIDPHWILSLSRIIYKRSRSDTWAEVVLGNLNEGDQFAFGDYNGDGRIEKAFFRPSSGFWHILETELNSENMRYEQWGMPGDRPCPGDYDGDGKTDLCVVRAEFGQLVWYIRRSKDLTLSVTHWGLATDTIYPNRPVDIDADGANDVLVSRNEGGLRVFYVLGSSHRSMFALQWGLASEIVKLGDYDGDGRTDFAAVREIDGQLVWFIHQSGGQMRVFYWGLPGDN